MNQSNNIVFSSGIDLVSCTVDDEKRLDTALELRDQKRKEKS